MLKELVELQTDVEPLVDAKRIAEILDRPIWWVRTAARTGEIPAYRIGPRYLRFRESEIHTWIEEQQAHKP